MGGVLGANVMRDHNVVFDYDNHLVGFAEGICDYRADVLDAGPGEAVGVRFSLWLVGFGFLPSFFLVLLLQHSIHVANHACLCGLNQLW